MPVRKAEAVWEGTLMKGSGTMQVASGLFEAAYSAGTRFGEEPGTNPEELIGAAHAGCFSMALSLELENAGYEPKRIHTSAKVHIDKLEGGFRITRVELDTEASVSGIDNGTFLERAEAAKKGCPVSQALAGVEVTLTARLAP